MAAPKGLSVPPERVWNMCMLAHVDHGKSALSDALISANGIISARMAGKVRYMDSREDEQRRGITMKSSSIALGHRFAEDGELYLVNLVDSPGHCDFSGEVEAALRVCDGAIVVVDIVEGVCVQTVSVLRAALEHGVHPVLVLNKLDRLFDELRLAPMEAYFHIQRVLEQINVVMGVRQVENMMARADLESTADLAAEDGDGPSGDWTFENQVNQEEEADDKSFSGYFSPEKGNVAFASAIDGWAFRLNDFAALFSKKFGISKAVLMKTLWGNFYLQPKTKKIVRKKAGDVSPNTKPMFVQFVLASLHSVYDALYSTQHDADLAIERREKIISKLELKISNRDLKRKDAKVALQAIMHAWLPAAPALLRLIIDELPNAASAQADTDRLRVLWPHQDRLSAEGAPDIVSQRKAITTSTSSSDAPVLAFVTKMLEPVGEDAANGAKMNIRMPKSRDELCAMREQKEDAAENGLFDSTAIDSESNFGLIAFARILAGTITVGDTLYVYGPRYAVRRDGSYDAATVHSADVTSLFLLMGRDMDEINKASAGNVVGIGGLSDVILKTATLSSLPPGHCLPLMSGMRSSLGSGNDAVVRVAVEPHLPGDMVRLQAGLRKLNQADPAVETYVTSKGEHVIAASGELHLERCLVDLRERFAKGVHIHVSRPIVSFRETVTGGTLSTSAAESQDRGKPSWNEGAESKLNSIESQLKGDKSLPGSKQHERDIVRPRNTEADRDPSENTTNTTMAWRTHISPARTGACAVVKSPFIKHGRFVDVQSERLAFRLCAAPLPQRFAASLDEAGAIARSSAISVLDSANVAELESLRSKIIGALEHDAASGSVRSALKSRFVKFWVEDVFPRIWTCGPRRLGSNILVGPRNSLNLPLSLKQLFWPDAGANNDAVSGSARENRPEIELEKAIVTAFQLASQAGPLCEEPMHGVAFFVDSIQVRDASENDGPDSRSVASGLAGLTISPTKEAMRLALLNANPRIMEAMLSVDVSVVGEALGKTYTVLAKRRGRVLSEDLRDGVNVFNVKAVLPVTESFGFADALRKQTSGLAAAQLVFSHWETVDVDPFWAPRTEEELEDLGREDLTESNNNLARKLVDSVRRRKGLKIEEKIVANAEKQRTLSKNK